MTNAKFKPKTDAKWTSEQLDKDTRINEHQLGFILWVEQYYMLHERLPDYDITCEHLTISEAQWREYWTYPPIRQALAARSIPVRLPDSATPDEGNEGAPAPLLTGRQLQLVNSLLNVNDLTPDHKKLSDAGVSKEEFQVWNADPVFREYYAARASKLEASLAVDADRALGDNVRAGDIQSIKYFNEKTGRYRPQDPQVVNFQLMVNQIIDILIANLTPEDAQRIGQQIINSVNRSGIQILHSGVSAGPPELPRGY